jgi:hypothetical protein
MVEYLLRAAKGKPLERVGRKATGLSFESSKYGRRAAWQMKHLEELHTEGALAKVIAPRGADLARKRKTKGAIVLQFHVLPKIGRPQSCLFSLLGFIPPLRKRLDLPQVQLLDRYQISHIVLVKGFSWKM